MMCVVADVAVVVVVVCVCVCGVVWHVQKPARFESTHWDVLNVHTIPPPLPTHTHQTQHQRNITRRQTERERERRERKREETENARVGNDAKRVQSALCTMDENCFLFEPT